MLRTFHHIRNHIDRKEEKLTGSRYATIPFEPYGEPTVTRPYTPAQQRGKCPDTHPVHLPQLMYEIMWETQPFNKEELWNEDGSQPFVFSMGDA